MQWLDALDLFAAFTWGGDCDSCSCHYSAEAVDARFRFFTFLLWAVIIVGFLWVLILCFKPDAPAYSQAPVKIAPPVQRAHKISPPKHRPTQTSHKSSLHHAPASSGQNHHANSSVAHAHGKASVKR